MTDVTRHVPSIAAARRTPDAMRRLSTDDLMRRVARGDQAAFSEIVDREAAAVITTVRRASGRFLVDALVRDVFVEMWRVAPVSVGRPASQWMAGAVHRVLGDASTRAMVS